MGKDMTITLEKETYADALAVSKYGFYLSIVNSVLMLLLSIFVKPTEVIDYGVIELTRSTNTFPLYFSLLWHVITAIFFRLVHSKVLEADKNRSLSEHERVSKLPNDEVSYDFSKRSFVEVLRPMGLDSNQWGFFWMFGLVLSAVGFALGGTSAVFIGVVFQAFRGSIASPLMLLGFAASLSEVVTFAVVTVQGLAMMPKLLQHSADVEWSRDFREVFSWRFGKKSLGLPVEDKDKVSALKRIKKRLGQKTTMLVKLPTHETQVRLMDYLRSSRAKIIVAKPSRIMATHGSWIAWEPRESKKEIHVDIAKTSENSSEVSVRLRFSPADQLLTLFVYLVGFLFVVLAWQLDRLLGVIIAVFLVLAIAPIIVWSFLERDAIVRDLWFSFHQAGILDVDYSRTIEHKRNMLEGFVDVAIRSFARVDNLFRMVLGASMIQSQDFPAAPIYLFRDHRSNLNKYGKSAEILGDESNEYDFAGISSRKASEIDVVKSNRVFAARYLGGIVAKDITKPEAALENIKIIGHQSTTSPFGPWGSPLMVGLGIILFIVSFEASGWSFSKSEFIYFGGLGFWALAVTILVMLFDTSSRLQYVPDYIQALLALALFPVIACSLYLLLPEGSYPVKISADFLSLAVIIFGLTVAPHTSGKPFSRTIYFYANDSKSRYFPFRDLKDAPFWLEAKH